MAEELSIEMQPPRNPARFLRNPRAIITLALIVLVIFAGIYSWWLSQGKISSVSARLDTFVYTVDPTYSANIESIDVKPGDTVREGQVLGRMDMADFARRLAASASGNSMLPQMPDAQARLNQARIYVKQLSEKLEQYQAEEDRLKAIMQEAVTDHVRAQLAMRALPQNSPAWQRAARIVDEHKAKMDQARINFERISQMRGAVLLEYAKVSGNIATRKGSQGSFNAEAQSSKQMPNYGSGAMHSPVAGKILRVNGRPQSMADTGQPLFVIMPMEPGKNPESWIQAWFPLDDQKKIELGQKVSIRFANGDVHVAGRVTAISSEAQPLPFPDGRPGPMNMSTLPYEQNSDRYSPERYMPVRITPDDPAKLANIPPGTSAECQIQTRYILGHSLF